MSSTAGKIFVYQNFLGSIVKNLVAQAIVDRILKAHESGEKFKVFIVLPLMPAFPGDISTA